MNPFWQIAFNNNRLRNLPLLPLLAIVLFIASWFPASAQTEVLRKGKPKITGQKDLTISEGESITIELTDLTVEDPDDWFYPWGFTLKVLDGDHYTVSNTTVTPDADFTGTLKVKVQVNDGQNDSDPYDLKITVISKNDAPTITGQNAIIVDEDNAFDISVSDLIIVDPDDSRFTLIIDAGNHYTVNNSVVTPELNYNGSLTIPVRVDDGRATSNTFNLSVSVNPVNDPPTINSQKNLVVNEDNPVTVTSSDFDISDPDDSQFTVVIQQGEHFTFSGATVTPESNYSGDLKIPVSVSDGKATSNTFNTTLVVNSINDTPKITGQNPLATDPGAPITVSLTDLQVSDPDNNFPQDFSLSILNGEKYSVAQNVITPVAGFDGSLAANVTVNDGQASSDIFSLIIDVRKGNRAPVITNQTPVIIHEDESYSVGFSDLQVTDPDDTYPTGFSISLAPGDHYTITNETVVPDKNYAGNITVPITVSDGKKSSEPFNFEISILPVNDPPEMSSLDNDTLLMKRNSEPVLILNDVTITDVDNETLALAEVWIDSAHYDPIADRLTFSNTTNIKGVFDSKSGALALIGKAPISEYVDALKSVRFEIAGTSMFKKKRVVFRVNDGFANSNRIHKDIRIVEEHYSLDIPSGFTPNGDQVNDTWSIVAPGNETTNSGRLQIYSKSGLLVFESEDLSASWDGKYNGVVLPPDVYYYTVKFDANGASSAVPTLKGIVTILR